MEFYNKMNNIATEKKSNINLINIKSSFILKKIFDITTKRKFLYIIKYNRKIQNRINININDYKQFSEIFSSIEIEIVPKVNRYGKFINIINKENEKYYHIYFNNDKKEVKRNILNENEKEKINIIKIIIDYQIISFEALFFKSECVESIYFKKFYRTNINNMSLMFYGCSSLKNINLSNIKTNNVTNMSDMFSRCSSLKQLNLSNFNTDNVTNMFCMFVMCSSLKELNLSNFNTDNVTNMSCMFSGCKSLEKLNVSNFNTNNVTNMSHMFYRCSSLKELNLSNFRTNNVKDMSFMFFDCSSLKELNISNFDIKKVINIMGMLSQCSEELKKKIKDQNVIIKETAFY